MSARTDVVESAAESAGRVTRRGATPDTTYDVIGRRRSRGHGHRARAGPQAGLARRRGGGLERRRRGYVQGQHGDPAHRFRRRARLPGVPPRPRGPTAPHLVRRRVRHPRRTGRRAPRRLGRGATGRTYCLVGQGRRQRLRPGADHRPRRGQVPRAAPRPRRTRASTCRGESIICPWTTTLAYATQAVRAGVDLHLNCRVRQVDQTEGRHDLTTDRGVVRTRYLVNAAGLHADTVDRLLGHDDFTVTPRRGQLIVFDKFARGLLTHILLPVPTALGKGVLVAPTVYGNVLLGPTAEEMHDKTATASSAEGIAVLREKGRRILPELLDEEVTAVYAGLRAATEHDDYRVRAHKEQRYVTVGGIRSTGLTASLAIAAHVTELLGTTGLDLAQPGALPPVRMPNLGEAFPRPYQRADLIAADPAYGTVVCHCERVTHGEIRDALAGTVPPGSPDGLRCRTRARGGRCQGFHCGPAVRELFEQGTRSTTVSGANRAGSRCPDETCAAWSTYWSWARDGGPRHRRGARGGGRGRGRGGRPGPAGGRRRTALRARRLRPPRADRAAVRGALRGGGRRRRSRAAYRRHRHRLVGCAHPGHHEPARPGAGHRPRRRPRHGCARTSARRTPGARHAARGRLHHGRGAAGGARPPAADRHPGRASARSR